MNYFKNPFTSTNFGCDVDLDALIDRIKISNGPKIFRAISQLGLHKAPGSNGMTDIFYKTYWLIVKITIIKFVQYLFRNGFFFFFLLKEICDTSTVCPNFKSGQSFQSQITLGLLLVSQISITKLFFQKICPIV